MHPGVMTNVLKKSLQKKKNSVFLPYNVRQNYSKKNACSNCRTEYLYHWQPTHVHNKNSNVQGRSPNVVKVNFHTIRNCS